MSSSDLPSIRVILDYVGGTQAAFCKRFMIPRRTLQNWLAGVNECPVYTRYLLTLATGYMEEPHE